MRCAVERIGSAGIPTVALVVAGASSAGGLTALVVNKLPAKAGAKLRKE